MGYREAVRRLFLFLFLVGCGARTDLGGSKGAGPACTKAPWILFDTQGGIAAVRRDGTDRHLLTTLVTSGDVKAFVPAMSPDGNSLVFITFSNDGEQELSLLDLPSGKRRTIAQVTPQPPHTGFGKAAISYDNEWIAFGNSPDLHLVAFDDTGDHVIVPGPFEEGCCPWSYGHPQFSADSSLIYYSTIGRLSSIRTDGSNNQLLYQDQFFSNPTIAGFVFPNVSLSNDGKKLVAQVACDVSELRIFATTDLPAKDPCSVGTKLVETGISQASNEASNPSWGPADVIAYDDGADVFLIPASGGSKTNLTQNGADAFAADPVWAPGCANVP